MTTTDVEREVLGFLMDDLESPQSLERNVCEALGRVVTRESIFSALLRLTYLGFAQAFEYAEASKSWRLVTTPNAEGFQSLWFKATPAGAAHVA